MQRRPIDVLFSLGFFGAAALLIVVGFVMADNTQFLSASVSTQIRDLHVAFPTSDQFSAKDLESTCLVANAGKMVASVTQAQCYADDFLGSRIDALSSTNTTPEQRDALARIKTVRSMLLTNLTVGGIGTHSRHIADVSYAAGALFALLGIAGLSYVPHEAAETHKSRTNGKPPTKVRRHPAAA